MDIMQSNWTKVYITQYQNRSSVYKVAPFALYKKKKSLSQEFANSLLNKLNIQTTFTSYILIGELFSNKKSKYI